jgi:hypothetical protein
MYQSYAGCGHKSQALQETVVICIVQSPRRMSLATRLTWVLPSNDPHLALVSGTTCIAKLHKAKHIHKSGVVQGLSVARGAAADDLADDIMP